MLYFTPAINSGMMGISLFFKTARALGWLPFLFVCYSLVGATRKTKIKWRQGGRGVLNRLKNGVFGYRFNSSVISIRGCNRYRKLQVQGRFLFYILCRRVFSFSFCLASRCSAPFYVGSRCSNGGFCFSFPIFFSPHVTLLSQRAGDTGNCGVDPLGCFR